MSFRSKPSSELFHGRFRVGVHIPVDKILKEELRVFEVACLVVIALAVDLAHGFGEVSFPPDPPFYVRGVKEILILLDELLRSEEATTHRTDRKTTIR